MVSLNKEKILRSENCPKKIKELAKVLDHKGIEYDMPCTLGDIAIYRIHFKYNNKRISVISGFGTYGGHMGLLEVMINDREPIGWLNAEEAEELIFKK